MLRDKTKRLRAQKRPRDATRRIASLTPRKPQALLVLGMHRSGTSALTRVLSLLGADLPKNLMNPGQDNETGHWESQDLASIHDDLLAKAGSAWDDWRAFNPDWIQSGVADTYKERLFRVLQQDFLESQTFLVKDPRICRFIPLWTDLIKRFDAEPVFIISLRNPLEVASSLRKRNGFTPAKSYLLWLRHALDSERETRGKNRAFVTYDELMADWRRLIAHISSSTGLRFSRRSDSVDLAIDSFLNQAQRHHSADDTQLQMRADIVEWVKACYRTLCEMAHTGEHDSHYRTLDRIFSEFETASRAFGLLDAQQTEQNHASLVQKEERVRQLETDLSATHRVSREQSALLAETISKSQTLTARILQAEQELESARNSSRTHEARISQLTNEIVAARAKIQQQEETAAQTTRDFSAIQEFLRESQTEVQRLSGELDTAERHMDRQQQELQKLVRLLQEKQTEAATRDATISDLKYHSAITQRSANESQAEIRRLIEELEEARNIAERQGLAISELNKQLRGERERSSQIQMESKRLVTELERARRELNSTTKERENLKKKVDQLILVSERERAATAELQRTTEKLSNTQRLLGERQQTIAQLTSEIDASRLLTKTLRLAMQEQIRIAAETNTEYQKSSQGFLSFIRKFLPGSKTPTSTAQRREYEAIRQSQVFDPLWYLGQYPDVAAAGQEPLSHYILHGADERRSPHPIFDIEWYSKQATDLLATELSPLGHYVTLGVERGLDPHPLFDTDWYLAQNPDVSIAGLNPLFHFCKIGADHGLAPHPEFDTRWYLEQNPDVARAGDNALVHYITHGAKEGRTISKNLPISNSVPSISTPTNTGKIERVSPSSDEEWISFIEQSGLFDAEWYLKTYRDIARAGVNPLKHYVENGRAELRNPGPGFDAYWYLEEYPQVRNSGLDPFSHYLILGREEGLVPVGSIYRRWHKRFDRITDTDCLQIARDIAQSSLPRLEILIAVDGSSEGFLEEIAKAIDNQIYENWRASIVLLAECTQTVFDRAASITRNRPRFRTPLRAQDYDFREYGDSPVVVVAGRVVLREHALYMFAKATEQSSRVSLIYADEDTLDDEGNPANPIFKPKYSPTLAEQTDYFGHCLLLRPLSNINIQINSAMKAADLTSHLAKLILHNTKAASVAHIASVLFHDLSPNSTNKKVIQYNNYDHQEKPGISIIIPTRDRVELLRPCIESIASSSEYPKHKIEIIVVDNGSTDEATLHYLESLSTNKQAIILRDPSAYNYSRLNNLAAAAASGEILVLLNNDIVITDRQWLNRLVYFARQNDVGAVGGRLLYPDHTIQHAGCALGIQGIAAHHLVGTAEDDPKAQEDMTRELSAVTGACLAIRKSVYNELGGLDTNVAVAFNDTLLCLNALKAGYRNIYIRDPLLIHFESKSRGYDDTPEKLAVLRRETLYSRARYNSYFQNDPYYSPNLCLQSINNLAFPPRHAKPWRISAKNEKSLKVLLLSQTHEARHPVAALLSLLASHLRAAGHDIYVGGPSGSSDLPYPGCTRSYFKEPAEAAAYAVEQDMDCVVAASAPFFSITRWLSTFPPVLILDGNPSSTNETTDLTNVDEFENRLCRIIASDVFQTANIDQMLSVSEYGSPKQGEELTKLIKKMEERIVTLRNKALPTFARI